MKWKLAKCITFPSHSHITISKSNRVSYHSHWFCILYFSLSDFSLHLLLVFSTLSKRNIYLYLHGIEIRDEWCRIPLISISNRYFLFCWKKYFFIFWLLKFVEANNSDVVVWFSLSLSVHVQMKSYENYSIQFV